MPSNVTQIRCLECHCSFPEMNMSVTTCPECGSGWLNAEYDYPTVREQWLANLPSREKSLWRYYELLPVNGVNPEISLQEGFTPLIRLYQYERLFNHPHLYVKDERQGPTSSFKDRQAALAVTAMCEAGITECVMASAGNAGVAYAAYCARAGIKLWLFVSSLVPSEKMREAMLYGAEVVKVTGTYDEAKRLSAEFAERRGIHLDCGARTIASKESMKTLAFEIAEQYGLQMHPYKPGTWQTPDWYIQAVSGGLGPLGLWKGFQELMLMGFIDKMPKLGIVQSAGCAPMVKAFQAGHEHAEAVVPKTLVTVLSTGNPGHSYVQLRQAALSNGGTMISVEDGEAFEAMRKLARVGGFSVEPAAAVAFAGLEKLLNNGTIQSHESVVINCSGHTFPVESYILNDQYAVNLELHPADKLGHEISLQEEGLGTALQNLDEQVTSILIVDDNPSDRRLIRRLLQRYKNYRIFEARGGEEGVMMAIEHLPDLVVTDLTMPEMDGFSLVEQLKNNAETAKIPIVVVSAKALTAQDKALLDQYSESVWTKGNFNTVELVEHVVGVLGDAPVEIVKTSQPSPTDAYALVDDTSLIVVIDDNARDRRLTRRLLESTRRYRVIEAENGRDGLKAIYEHQPDLIVLDLMLPDMDGFRVYETLHSDRRLRQIPIVIISAKDLTIAEREQLEDGIRAIITKSAWDREEFLKSINDALLQSQ